MYALILLGVTYALLISDDAVLAAIATGGLVLAFMLGGRGIAGKRPLACLMLAAALVSMLLMDRPLLDVLAGARPFTATIVLVVAVSLLSVLINPSATLRLLARLAQRNACGGKGNFIMCSSAMASSVLNMATPVLYGRAFAGQPPVVNYGAAINIKHGMMVAMLVVPTFAPIAMVIASHPGVQWESTLLFTVPLALITLGYYLLTGQGEVDMPAADAGRDSESGLGWIILYVLLLALLVFAGHAIVSSIVLSAELTIMAALLYGALTGGRPDYASVDRRCRELVGKLDNEGLVFIASGVLLLSISHGLNQESWLYSPGASLSQYVLVPAVVLFLPLLGLANIHPVIGFTLVQPVTGLNHELHDLQKYLLWVCYWVVSLQISPISVINLTTSQAFGVTAKSLTGMGDIRNVYILGFIYTGLILLYGVLLK